MIKNRYAEVINDLIKHELDAGKLFQFRVSTASMLPMIKPEDKIVVRRDALDNLSYGDIVVFEKYNERFTHRLLQKKCSGFRMELITKGDNALMIDEPVFTEELLGRVVAINRGNKLIILNRRFWKIANRLLTATSVVQWKTFVFLRKLKKLIFR